MGKDFVFEDPKDEELEVIVIPPINKILGEKSSGNQGLGISGKVSGNQYLGKSRQPTF